MPAVGLTEEQFARVFGPRDDLDSNGPGRSRRCRSCNGWHRTDQPWPHNCRSEAPPRNPDLATPLLAPRFDPFLAGAQGDPDAEYIGSRNDKREYMKRHDLTEYESGVADTSGEWSRQIDERREVAETVKRFMDTDTEYWTPEQRGEVAATEMLETEGADVDVGVAEISDGTE